MAEQLQRVSIHDVARTAGVSTATVSKVLNGRYGVAVATSARVQRVIDDLGYESSLVARSLRSHRTNVIGVLVAEFEPFSTEILKGVSRSIGGTGYELLAYSAGGRDGPPVGWERRYLSRLSGTLIDGAILVTPTVVDPGSTAPVVAIDAHAGSSAVPTVASDNLRGAVVAVDHLLDLGHRRIGFLGGLVGLDSSRLREEGYRSALTAAGVPVEAGLMRIGGYRRETALAPARELLTLSDRPTAIFAANDLSAIATMEVARELGLRIPDDLSVIGFDNVPESAMTTPQLTTINQSMQQLGSVALEMLVRLLDGTSVNDGPGSGFERGAVEPGDVERSTHVQLPIELVIRASTCAPAASA